MILAPTSGCGYFEVPITTISHKILNIAIIEKFCQLIY